MKIACFGHFGWTNLGNEATLKVFLEEMRRRNVEFECTCICSGPDAVKEMYNISAIPSRTYVFKPWSGSNPFLKLMRKLVIPIPSEIIRWVSGVRILHGTDALIVPGTGLLTDAFGLLGWGPYDLLRWAFIAKLCGCKVCFVNVGAGPVYSRIGRFCVKTALKIADFRSYRDEASRQYLKGMGLDTEGDSVSPDLVFSMHREAVSNGHTERTGRRVVGLGVMNDSGKYSLEKPDAMIYQSYLNTLADFTKWLLDNGYDVRLLIGDFSDRDVIPALKCLLERKLSPDEMGRVFDEPIENVDDLLRQIEATDFVVGTRFHNLVLSMILQKPLLAISFHHKCSSLMAQMGIEEYCQDIERVNVEELANQFRRLERNAETVKQTIAARIAKFRSALDEDYRRFFALIPAG